MSYFADEQSPVDDLRGQVFDDTPCRKCSYNLRGLPKEGRCPECGTAIGVSICGDLLRFSHPQWLRQVSDGLMMILWGLLVSIIVSVASGMIMRDEPVIRQIFVTLGSLVGVIGTWQMTTADPSGIGEAPGLTARKIVRIAVIAGLVANIAQLTAGVGVASFVVAAVSALCGLIGLVGEFAKIHYIGLLAARIPDESLRGRANFLKWALVICYGAIIALGLLMAVVAVSALSGMAAGGGASRGPVAALGGAMVCLMLPAAIALIVFAIMTLVLIYRAAQAIKAQIPLSIDLWNRAARRAAAAPATSTAPPPPVDPATGEGAKLPVSEPPPTNQRPYF